MSAKSSSRGSWACLNCATRNLSAYELCTNCHQKRPWKCTSCSFLNDNHQTRLCQACKTERDENVGASPPAKGESRSGPQLTTSVYAAVRRSQEKGKRAGPLRASAPSPQYQRNSLRDSKRHSLTARIRGIAMGLREEEHGRRGPVGDRSDAVVYPSVEANAVYPESQVRRRPPSAVIDAEDYVVCGDTKDEPRPSLQGSSAQAPPSASRGINASAPAVGSVPTIGSLSQRLSHAHSHAHMPRLKQASPKSSASYADLPRMADLGGMLGRAQARQSRSTDGSDGIDAQFVKEDGTSSSSEEEDLGGAAAPNFATQRLPPPRYADDDDDSTSVSSSSSAEFSHGVRDNMDTSSGSDDDSDSGDDDSSDYDGSVISSETEYTIERSDSDSVMDNPASAANVSNHLAHPLSSRVGNSHITSWNLRNVRDASESQLDADESASNHPSYRGSSDLIQRDLKMNQQNNGVGAPPSVSPKKAVATPQSINMARPRAASLDDDRIRAHQRHRRRKQLAAINPAHRAYFLTDAFFELCRRQVAYSRYELDEIAIFDLETKGWCIGGDILSQRVRPIPPISPQYGDRVRCYLRVGVYDASQDLCTILEEINPFSALFNPRKPNPDVDPFDDLDADGNPVDGEDEYEVEAARGVNSIMRKRAVAFTVGDPAISRGLSDGVMALPLGDSMHLVVTPDCFKLDCELHRGANVPEADYYVYSVSLIKLTIGSDSAGGSKSSNPIIAAESQARAAEAALAESNIDAASLAESEDGDGRVRSVVPKRVSFDKSAAKSSEAADLANGKQQRDSFVIGGVRVGGLVVGGIMVDDDGGIVTPGDGINGLAGDGAGANVDDTPKNFRAQNGDALEAQQLASTSDMLQGRVSPANSDGEDDELDELMDEFGFPLLRRGRRCRRLQSSLEQAARSMSSGVSIGSRDTGGTSGSSGSSTGRRRVFSGQSNFEFDRAMERAQRSSSILLQPLFHFELNMEQFDDLTGQGWAITRRWDYQKATLQFQPLSAEACRRKVASNEPVAAHVDPAGVGSGGGGAKPPIDRKHSDLLPLHGQHVELRYIGYSWDPYTMGAPEVFVKSWCSQHDLAENAARGDSGAPLFTMTVGEGDIVRGIDRALRKEDLGQVFEVVVSPTLGFGAEPHLSESGVNVPGNSCLIFRVYVHRIYGEASMPKAPRDSGILARPGASLHLSAVSGSEEFKKILKKASLGEDSDAADVVLMSGDMMFRKSFQWGARYVVLTLRTLQIYKRDEKGEVMGAESDREYTFSSETTIRALRRMPRTFELLGLVCKRRKSKMLHPRKTNIVHRIFLQAPANELEKWTHVFTLVTSRCEELRQKQENKSADR